MSEELVAQKIERTEEQPFDVVTPTKERLTEESKISPQEYEFLHKKPYLADKYKINWENIREDLDVFKLREKLGTISKTIIREMRDKKLKDTVDSYDMLLKELEYSADVLPNEEPESIIKKIYWYLKHKNKAIKIRDKIREGI